MSRRIIFTEERSGLAAQAVLLDDVAPANAGFLWDYLERPRTIPSMHAMWTGPEISCPVPDADITPEWRDWVPPVENGTMFPAAGDVVLAHVPPRMWGGVPHPIFDIGLFYAPGGRLLLPVGWVVGSLCAQVQHEDLAALKAACTTIRRNGVCTIEAARVE